MNKKGEEVLSIWWLLIIAIIGVFISIGVIIFYSYPLDVRLKEADILSVRVADCIMENGKLAFDLSKEGILKNCNLNEKVLDSGKYYLQVKDVKIGNKDFETYCKLEGENYPKCSEKNIYVLDKNKEKLKIRILVASNNFGRKIG